MDKKTVSQILSIAISAVIALLAVFGYHVTVSPITELPPTPTPAPVYDDAAVLAKIAALADDVSDVEASIIDLEMGDGATSFAAYNTNCYKEQGGDKWVCASGGEMEFQSGSTLDVQSGATFNNPAGGTQGNTTITGTLAVSGTSDLVGNISSSTGAVTVADTLNVTGNASFVGIVLDGKTYVSSTAAITIAGVLTDVHLIYLQN
jgi:hypothetical protein